MDWHCINISGSPRLEAADLVLALEAAYDSAGEPPDAEVFMGRLAVGEVTFYLSPAAAGMAPDVLRRYRAVLCDPPPDLHRCEPMRL